MGWGMLDCKMAFIRCQPDRRMRHCHGGPTQHAGGRARRNDRHWQFHRASKVTVYGPLRIAPIALPNLVASSA